MEIRLAVPSDAPFIAHVHVRSRHGAYRGLLPASFLAGLSVERRERMWGLVLNDPEVDTFVAEGESGQIVGFSSVQRSRDPEATTDTGELTAIYVDPDEWGRGYGRALLSAAVERARLRGFDCLTLWVLESNRRAMRFYEASGFQPDGAEKREERGEGVVLHEVRYMMGLGGSNGKLQA